MKSRKLYCSARNREVYECNGVRRFRGRLCSVNSVVEGMAKCKNAVRKIEKV